LGIYFCGKTMTTSYEYWSLDIPGLTEAQANAIRERLAAESGRGIVNDPRYFMAVAGTATP
jgi:hypothetical protein